MEESQKRIEDDDDKSLSGKSPQKVVSGEFEDYLVNALNDSLTKKSNKHPIIVDSEWI